MNVMKVRLIYSVIALTFLITFELYGQIHPDAVYPIPNLYGSTMQQGINLFTGDINYSTTLASLQGRKVSYTLEAFYNSRSAYINNYSAGRNYYFTPLGGYGWKLMDYPKIVQDSSKYFLLDGKQMFALQVISSSGGTTSYTAGSDYFQWKIVRTGNGFATDQWNIATETGDRFIFNQPGITTQFTVWNFSKKADPQWGDSLYFNYGGGSSLQSIANVLGDTLRFVYQQISNRSYLTQILVARNGTVNKQISLSYSPYTFNGTTYSLLTQISSSLRIAPGIFDQANANIIFSYIKSSSPPFDYNGGALQSITSPAGQVTSYTYTSGTIYDRMVIYPVVQCAVNVGYNNNSSSAVDPNTYTSINYNFIHVTWGNTRVYAYYNDVQVFPGGKYQAPIHDDEHPFGNTELYFFTGKPASSLEDFPHNYDTTLAVNPLMLGLPYQTKTNNDSSVHSKDQEKASSIFYWQIGYVVDLKTSSKAVKKGGKQSLTASIGGYQRLAKINNELYGVENTAQYQYDDALDVLIGTISARTNPKMQSSAGAVKDSVKQLTTYAFQQYPALNANGLHILSPIARIIQVVKPSGSVRWDTTACTATQWTMWDGQGNPNASFGKWAEWKYYAMKDSSANTGSVFSPAPNPQQWLKTNEILKRTPTGVPSGSIGIDSVRVYTTFASGRFGDYPIATFTNSNPSNNESFYFGFEPYELFDPSQQPNAKFDSSDAHTGKRNLNVQNFTYQFTAQGTARKYINSFWYKTTDALPTVLYFGSRDSMFNRITLAPTYGQWTYVQNAASNLQPGTDYSVNIIHPGLNLYVDDMRCSPVNVPFSASVYNESKQAIASINTNGATNYSVYNRYQDIIATAGPDSARNVRSLLVSYNSRKGNATFSDSTGFDPNQPNTELNVNAKKGGVWEGFQFASTQNFPPANLSNMVIQNGLLVCNGSPVVPATATYAQSISASNFSLYTESISNNLIAGQEVGISITNGANTIRFSLASSQYKLYNVQSGVVYKSSALAKTPQSVSLTIEVVEGSTLFAYADGRFIFSYQFTGTIGGSAALYSTNPGSYFKNFIFINEPIIGNSTFDASSQMRQSLQRKNGNEVQVTAQLYGSTLNLNSAQTRPAYVGKTDKKLRLVDTTASSGMPLSYIQNFANYNYHTMNLDSSSVIINKFGYTNPYSFSKRYHKSPMLLTKATGSGGTFAADSNATKYHYGSNHKTIMNFKDSTLTYMSVINPDSLMTQNLTNLQGFLFGAIASGSGDTIRQQYEYDKFMRRTKEVLPNYFPQGLNNPNFFNQSGYSFVGNRTSYRTPDAGTKKYIYNNAAVLRFMVDSVGLASSPNIILYWKYDELDRLQESGYMRQAWNEAALQGYANSRIYPDSTVPGLVWRKRYTYDGNNSAFDLGRLTKLESNNNSDSAPDVEEKFKYDIYGNIIEKAQRVFAFDTAAYIVKYQYDLLGRVVQVDQGVGVPTTYAYNRLGQVESVGTPANPTYYASYTYKDTILSEILNNGTLPRLYDLNPAGWVDKIQDKLFTDSLTYTHGGLDGAGYFSGNIASATTKFGWSGAPMNYTYKYKYDSFARLNAGYIVETDANDLNYALYDDNGNIRLLQRWKDKTVYWNSLVQGKNTLVTAKITGLTSPGNVYTGSSNYYGLALDPFGQKVYWANAQLKIQQANLDGTGLTTLPVILSMFPSGISVDALHQKLYIAVPANGNIIQTNLNGTNQTNIVVGANPQNIVVDANGGKIYWPDGTAPSTITIKRANLDGSNIQTLITFPSGAQTLTVSGFALDTLRKKMYWSTAKAIQRANLDGTSIETIFQNGTSIQQISVDIFNREIFWTDYINGTIQYITFDKTGLTTAVSGLDSPNWIVQNIFSNIYTYKQGTNQLLGAEGTTNDFAYDGNGNITSSASKRITSLMYDPYTGLVNQATRGGSTVSFQYGGTNQRVMKSYNDTSLLYIHGLSEYPLVEKIKTSAGPQSLVSYVYGPTGLIAINYNNNTYFVLKDHLGSVRIITNNANAVVANLNYSPFGELMNDVSSVTANAPPLRYFYTSQEYDPQTGLYNYRARLYDPNIGRFLEPDPGNQFSSVYAYVGNNPIIYTDPTGMFWKELLGGAVTAVAVVGGAVAIGLTAPVSVPAMVGVALTGAFLGGQIGLMRDMDQKDMDRKVAHGEYGVMPSSQWQDWTRWKTYDINNFKDWSINAGNDGRPSNSKNQSLAPGWYMYTLDVNNNFRYLPTVLVDGEPKQLRSHSQLSGGVNVRAAGWFNVGPTGFVTEIDNASGHYRPGEGASDYARDVLRTFSIYVTETKAVTKFGGPPEAKTLRRIFGEWRRAIWNGAQAIFFYCKDGKAWTDEFPDSDLPY